MCYKLTGFSRYGSPFFLVPGHSHEKLWDALPNKGTRLDIADIGSYIFAAFQNV